MIEEIEVKEIIIEGDIRESEALDLMMNALTVVRRAIGLMNAKKKGMTIIQDIERIEEVQDPLQGPDLETNQDPDLTLGQENEKKETSNFYIRRRNDRSGSRSRSKSRRKSNSSLSNEKKEKNDKK